MLESSGVIIQQLTKPNAMKSYSTKTRRSPFRRWCQVIPVALLSLPMFAMAQPVDIININEMDNTDITKSFVVTVPNGTPFSLSDIQDWDLTVPNGHATQLLISSGYSFSGGLDPVVIPEPDPADGVNWLWVTDFNYPNQSLSVGSDDLFVARFGGKVVYGSPGDTGIGVYDPTGAFMGDVYFFDNAVATPDAASTLPLSLMAVAALFGAARFKLIPLASASQA